MDKAFLHDLILDSECQMSEAIDIICDKRQKLMRGNEKLLLMDIYALCGTIKNLAEEMQEKLGEYI